MAAGLSVAHSSQAQQRDAQSFLTGVKPQDIVFQKVIDVPHFAGPNVQPQTTTRFSFREMLAKVFPFISSSNTPSFNMAVPLLPGANQGSPFQPVLPQFGAPQASFGNGFPIALPRTTLPIPPENTLKPVLPIP
jgi:hypothetical protein